MELVRIFRVLLRHRILMGLGVVLAVAVGVLAMGGQQHTTGAAGLAFSSIRARRSSPIRRPRAARR